MKSSKSDENCSSHINNPTMNLSNEGWSVFDPSTDSVHVSQKRPPIVINPSPEFRLETREIESSSPIIAPIPARKVSVLNISQNFHNIIVPNSPGGINLLSPEDSRAGRQIIMPNTSNKLQSTSESRIVSIEGLIHRVGSIAGRHPTTISFYQPRTTFRIEDHKIHDFWVGYCQLASNEITNQSLTLGEAIIPSNVPVVSDIRLEFHNDLRELDDTTFIYALVHVYQHVISKVIDLSDSRIELAAVILKSGRTELENGNIGYYYRIQFPYCRVSMDFLERILRPMIVHNFDKCLSRLNADPIGSRESMIKSSFVDGYLPLYMSRARSTYPTLEYVYTLDEIDVLGIEEAPMNLRLDIERYLPLGTHDHAIRRILDLNRLSEDPDHTFWLPLILSVNYYTKVATVSSGVINDRASNSPLRISRSESRGSNDQECEGSSSLLEEEENDEDHIWIARKLLPLLSSSRFSKEPYWLSIGEALFNITDGSDKGLNWWIRQSMVSNKYKAKHCKKVWTKWCNTSDPIYGTVKTIAYFARQDRPRKYAEWLDSWCKSALSKATTNVHTDVATALYRIYWLDYTCSSTSKGGQWYMFDKHHWKRLDNAHKLKRILSKDFVKRFERMRTEVSRKIEMTAGEGHTKSSLEMLITKIGKLIAKLGNVSFKKNIITEAGEHFYDENFDKLKDTNPNLLGVYNGVIETTNTEAVFRDGKPEDYLTKFSCVRFDPKMNEKSKSVRFLRTWLRQTFKDKALISMFLCLMSSRLKSKNSEKRFPIWSGKSGDNSKSMWKKLTEQAFGPYSITLSEAILTEKPTAKGPSPELARANKTKIAWITEPDEDDPIRNGTLKKLTGGDNFFARNLNENGDGDMILTFMLFMMCNRIPSIPKSERTIIERLIVIPFLSRWANDAPDDPAEQYRLRIFKRDKNFEEKIPSLTAAFLWMLVNKYSEYCRTGLVIPEVVKEYTSKYWEETDVYNLFKQDKIEMVIVSKSICDETPNGVPDLAAWIETKEVYSLYVNWFQDNMSGVKIPHRTTVIDELSNRWGTPSNGRWTGMRVKTDNGSSNMYSSS
uniref:D5-like helicase-primase n=1 Tax=Pithovirus LCPAC202 TaxID=2506592 RepID=A0A481Z6Z9_9VIRU|nr:MAG: D5-like helicase-primase [Pithovirus LCPAC202]